MRIHSESVLLRFLYLGVLFLPYFGGEGEGSVVTSARYQWLIFT